MTLSRQESNVIEIASISGKYNLVSVFNQGYPAATANNARSTQLRGAK